MDIELLVSTMNREDFSFLEKMNITTNAVVINQNNTNSDQTITANGRNIRFICNNENGLSKSRNLALEHSRAEICVLADDDLVYVDDYADIIIQAHKEYKEADIIAFQVERIGKNGGKVFRNQKNRENYLTCLKISSVEITFKREAIIKNKIKFNELIGAGTDFYAGEENIFLYDVLKKGLKVMYLPLKIASVSCDESTWFEGYTAKYFKSRGAAFYNMTNRFYHILSMQFALRKYKLYREQMSIFSAYREMIHGVKDYKEHIKNKKVAL